MNHIDTARVLRYGIPGLALLLLLALLGLMVAARRGEQAAQQAVPPEPAQDNAAQTPATAEPMIPSAPTLPADGGMRIVYDASYSMCGFLAEESDGLFARLARALEARASKQANPTLLLGEKDGRGSLQPAPTDFHANRRSAKSPCAPFVGWEAYPSAIFDLYQEKTPRSVLFVSDAQLLGRARDGFIGAFESWYAARPAGAVVSAGIVTFSVPFVGDYYPLGSGADDVGGKPAKTRGDPQKFAVPRYDRLLSLLWFSSDEGDTAFVRDLLGLLNALDNSASDLVLYRQQFIPLRSSDPARWFAAVPPLRRVDQLLDTSDLEIVDSGSQRDMLMLKDCVAPAVLRDDTLRVVTDKLCRDSKPFFATGHETIALKLQVKANSPYRIAVPAFAAGVAVSSPDERTIRLEFNGESPEPIVLALKVDQALEPLDDERLSRYSFDSEPCLVGQKNKDLENCVTEKLTHRTYQFDTLVRAFAASADAVRRHRAGAAAKGLRLTIALGDDTTR